MTMAELNAYHAFPDETTSLGEGFTITHKREREAYIKGYHRAIEEAVEWLQENVRDYLYAGTIKDVSLIEDFRQQMEN